MIANRIDAIRTRLNQALSPSFIEVIDESAQHAGHVGAQSGAGHFFVRITSAAFSGKKPLECHRMIYSALDDMMHSEIHALRIQVVP